MKVYYKMLKPISRIRSKFLDLSIKWVPHFQNSWLFWVDCNSHMVSPGRRLSSGLLNGYNCKLINTYVSYLYLSLDYSRRSWSRCVPPNAFSSSFHPVWSQQLRWLWRWNRTRQIFCIRRPTWTKLSNDLQTFCHQIWYASVYYFTSKIPFSLKYFHVKNWLDFRDNHAIQFILGPKDR